ncbi:4400_t:CDS:2 [Ambispora gerdemannii]|uniref:4400_t:CDS:1 n=1 Tax=Ambispora gerdemannii TaxID=144530 RepID=A0A9N9AGU0_9GLOM|nr:4400_t:CDS:2 [Ambispora gerdemannii]
MPKSKKSTKKFQKQHLKQTIERRKKVQKIKKAVDQREKKRGLKRRVGEVKKAKNEIETEKNDTVENSEPEDMIEE